MTSTTAAERPNPGKTAIHDSVQTLVEEILSGVGDLGRYRRPADRVSRSIKRRNPESSFQGRKTDGRGGRLGVRELFPQGQCWRAFTRERERNERFLVEAAFTKAYALRADARSH